jgi:hypothetical protein
MLGKRFTALSLVLAGVCFFLYQVIRPYSDESSLEGARAYASNEWVVSHSLAMVGFILLILGLHGVHGLLLKTRVKNAGLKALLWTWIGVGFTLPYYGAETFGLHELGKEALRRNNTDLLVTLTNAIRFGEGAIFFGIGLVAIAVGTILFAIAVWHSGTVNKWGAVFLMVAFVLYLPQFYTSHLVRSGHGLLVLVGCWYLAWSILQQKSIAKHL